MRKYLLIIIILLFPGGLFAANDFSGDSNCVALYTFESSWSGGTLTDDKGSNDLTDTNTVTEDTTDYKEGSQSAEFESGNTEYFTLTDGSLDAGFPGKSSGGSTDLSVCFWMRLENDTDDQYMVTKYNAYSERSWAVEFYQQFDRVVFRLGYNGGASVDDTSHLGNMDASKWYHVSIAYDDDGGGDSKGNVKIRIWDDNAGSILQSGGNDTHSEDTGQQMSVDVAAFALGCIFVSGSPTDWFDGELDEVVIFKDVLSEAEMDQIRSGTYGNGAGVTIPVLENIKRQRRRR